MLTTLPEAVLTAQKIFVNHSGGKDSQAMLAALVAAGLKDKLILVHADLGEMEWEPMQTFITANSFGIELVVVKPAIDFFELCRKYKRLPSGLARFCTSELKTRPIGQWIKSYCKEHGITKAVNAMGIRADESQARAKKDPLKRSKLATKALELTEWYPIFDYKLADVWATIASAGQQPHTVYSRGYSRLSCVFCVFGRIDEHKMAAKERPELFKKMADLEQELGKSIRMKQVAGVKSNKYLREYCS